jgi:hypothetical protein
MISETHECINNDLHNILKNKHETSNITTPFEYQPIPIYDALLYLREYYMTIIHNLLVEIIKSRILMEYVNNTNISNDKSNQYIPWDIELMCNIPNPMPQTFHSKSNNSKNAAERSAQQDLIMINTLPGIVQSINGIHSCALTIQHLRIIDAYNQYVNIINSNFKEHMNNLPPDLKSPMLNNQLQDYQIEGLMNYAYMCIFFTSH